LYQARGAAGIATEEKGERKGRKEKKTDEGGQQENI